MTLVQKSIESSPSRPFHQHLTFLTSIFFKNMEKLVGLLVYSSFRQVATSGIRNTSVATSCIKWISVSRAQMKSAYGVTPYSP